MKRELLLFGLVMLSSMVQGNHLHPRSLASLDEIEVEDNKSEKMDVEVDGGMPIEVFRIIRQNRFVPLNNEASWDNTPCEEGLQKDAQGVCRVVFD